MSAATTLLKSNELPKTSPNRAELSDNDNDGVTDHDSSITKKAKTEDKKSSSSSNVIVAGILPGIGNYDSDTSSDSNSSTSDDDDEQDLSTSEIIGCKVAKS